MKGTQQPNILLVVTHDTGRHLSCYGRRVHTPNFERLAGEGARFDNYFCTAPVCGPSRGSIVTGRYPHTNSRNYRGFAQRQDGKSLPRHFIDRGYASYLFGIYDEAANLQLLGYEHVDPHGMDRKPNTDGATHRIQFVAPRVCDFLMSYREKQPFFTWVGLYETHRPYHISHSFPDDPDTIEVPPYLPSHPLVRQDVADLNGSVKALDEGLGTILDALDDSGLASSTVVIYTTDHGIAMPRAKGSLYDAGLGTALLMRWPGMIKGGSVYDQLLCNVDLMPTLLDGFGIEIPQEVDGRSFFSLLRGKDVKIRDSFFSEVTWHCRYRPMRGLRTERYKYIRHFHKHPGIYMPYDVHASLSGGAVREDFYNREYAEEEFYDLSSDPLEVTNLINDQRHKRTAGEMRATMQEWLERTDDPVLSQVLPGQEHVLWEEEKKTGRLPANQW